MVQGVLRQKSKTGVSTVGGVALVIVFLLSAAYASKEDKRTAALPPPPDLLLQGGRKLAYERSFSSDRDVRKKPGFLGKVVNIIAGEPEVHPLVRPYSIVVDSRGRAIITDPGAAGVHIFDFVRNKYKFVERRAKGKDAMLVPQCVAVDDHDNIYVTDSSAGKIFVFNSDGKYQHALGSLKGGEGFFKRPTGIAVDSSAQRIYITDTLRDKIFVLDFQGRVIETIGEHGEENGKFNFPTELKLKGQELAVVDAMNFRVQLLDRRGSVQTSIGHIGDSSGSTFRPKGVAVDSEGHYYVVDGLWAVVQVFDRDGRLLFYFGKKGTGAGDFQLPAGLFIDSDDRIYVVDSYNRRVQVFRYFGAQNRPGRGSQ
jgi:DNA-binding beta-propeller fold protein YncE